jgi:molybdopterin synthase sulfur carrier subunit
MIVEVRYFASLVERVGCSSERVEVRDDADIAALWSLLQERHPELSELGFRPAAACDLTYADWDRPLEGVREVAFLPPVSGG